MALGQLSIGVVARQTGVDVSTLRKWESRYGFPQPLYLPSGQRRYTDDDVQKIRAIMRRIQGGERAGAVIKQQLDQLLLGNCAVPTHFSGLVSEAISALSKFEIAELKSILAQAQEGASVVDFVEQFASPLAEAVGVSWAQGLLPAFAEHLFSTVLESTLTQVAERFLPGNEQPKVLLTTPSGETHTLGLAMANAVICSEGISTLRLPSHMPIQEISECAIAFKVRIVGLSVSKRYPPRLLLTTLEALRHRLPDDIDLWLGGEGVNRLKTIPNRLYTFDNWQDALATLRRSIAR